MIQKALAGLRAVRPAGPPVTLALIGACCLVFVLGPASGLDPSYGTGEELRAARQDHFGRWGVVPAELLTGRPGALPTPLTALFVHAGWLHLLGNVLFLRVFGGMAEERLGRARFLVLYLATGCVALLGHAAAHPGSVRTLVGASGAVSGVLGAFLRLFPTARVTGLFPFLFFLPLRLPAWVVLPFWAALQGVAAGGVAGSPEVAHLAHLVGFSAGFLCARALVGGVDRVSAPVRASEGDSQP